MPTGRTRGVCASRLAMLACMVNLAWPCAISCRDAGPVFDGERAMKTIEELTAMGPRYPGGKGREPALAYIRRELGRHTQSVTVDRFEHTTAAGTKLGFANLRATFGPQKGPAIVVAAHWDTRPRADRDPDPERRAEPVPGANDGASGVAVLLELARCLSRADPVQTVELVFFDGEDYGDFEKKQDVLIGSQRFARKLKKNHVKAALILDMVGDRNLQLPAEGNSFRRAPELTSEVYARARRLGHGKVFSLRVRHTLLDDHVPLLDAGIQAVDLIDFDYRHWHTAADTPDKCSSRSLAIVGEVVLDLLLHYDPSRLPAPRRAKEF